MMEWEKGEILGKGSFSSVYLATPRRNFYELPPLMAVKSSSVSQSSLLHKEKEILTHLRDCPQILNCFGDDLTVEKNGEKFYNIFLELASGGNLAQLLKKSGGSISESHVRVYTRSILQGLLNIHEKGYVHCDIKLQNILVCRSCDGSTEVKIADFGLAKKAGQMKKMKNNSDDEFFSLRGTPLYMSPESVSNNEFESPSDIWALGCVISELISGKPAWRCRADSEVSALLYRIGFRNDLPEIPDELSEEGKDFLNRCFVRDPTKRWTAEMLLNHPFIVDSNHLPTTTTTIISHRHHQPSPPPSSSLSTTTTINQGVLEREIERLKRHGNPNHLPTTTITTTAITTIITATNIITTIDIL